MPTLLSRPALALQKPTLRGARDAASDEDTIVDGTERGERERVPGILNGEREGRYYYSVCRRSVKISWNYDLNSDDNCGLTSVWILLHSFIVF